MALFESPAADNYSAEKRRIRAKLRTGTISRTDSDVQTIRGATNLANVRRFIDEVDLESKLH